MNRTVLWIGVALVVPTVVFLAIGLTKDPHQIDSPLIGKAAPPFSLVDLDGEVVRFEDLKGKPIVLNFWATWCRPCIAEHQVFRESEDIFQDRIAFLGVIYQDEERKVRSFLRQSGAWGTTLLDPTSAVSVAYGVYGVPETYLINTEGIVAEKITGPVDPQNFSSKLQGLF